MADILHKLVLLQYDQDKISLDVVCYGIGQISVFRNAEYQLALIILVIRRNIFGYFSSCKFHFYDPIMNAIEIAAMEHFSGIQILQNEEGKRRVSAPTLFYMPHCGKALYNNLLWANWKLENLRNLIIVGNSFSGYVDKTRPTRRGKSDSDLSTENCIRSVIESDALIEMKCSNQFPIIGSFNDLSLHIVKSKEEIFKSVPDEYKADGRCDTIIPKE